MTTFIFDNSLFEICLANTFKVHTKAKMITAVCVLCTYVASNTAKFVLSGTLSFFLPQLDLRVLQVFLQKAQLCHTPLNDHHRCLRFISSNPLLMSSNATCFCCCVESSRHAGYLAFHSSSTLFRQCTSGTD